jgi:predicted lipoprotein
MRLVLAALLAGLAVPAFAQSVIPNREIVEGAVDGYIRPAFAAFAAETDALQQDVAALCAAPSADALAAAQDGFRATVVAFSRIEFVRIGPLRVGDRYERLLFWPDRKGIALRQVQGALAEEDPTAASPETLKEKSVAMQGLVGLEYLLFGTGSTDLAAGAEYRCNYASASSSLIAGLADTLSAEWHDDSPSGPKAALTDPKPDAEEYRTELEAQERLASTLIHGTETIRDQRIMPILGTAQGSPQPRSALFWRSNMTVPALAANFDGLHDFFLAARYPEAVGVQNAWVANGAIFEFENAARAAAAITDPIETAVTDPEQFDALKYMSIITGSLDHLLGENLAAMLGLAVGFSALDGD